MAQVGLSEAAEALRDFFGPRIMETEADGPRRMIEALVQRLNLSEGEARKLVDDLINAGSVHYVPARRSDVVPPNAPVVGNMFGAQGLPTSAGADVADQTGYWQFK